MASHAPSQPFVPSLPFPHSLRQSAIVVPSPAPTGPSPMLSLRNIDKLRSLPRPIPKPQTRIEIWRDEVSERCSEDSTESVPELPLTRRTSFLQRALDKTKTIGSIKLSSKASSKASNETTHTEMYEGSRDTLKVALREEETGSSMWLGSESSARSELRNKVEEQKHERLIRAARLHRQMHQPKSEPTEKGKEKEDLTAGDKENGAEAG